jgi:predicted Zn-ribbon and HTH transcriptional regulator
LDGGEPAYIEQNGHLWHLWITNPGGKVAYFTGDSFNSILQQMDGEGMGINRMHTEDDPMSEAAQIVESDEISDIALQFDGSGINPIGGKWYAVNRDTGLVMYGPFSDKGEVHDSYLAQYLTPDMNESDAEVKTGPEGAISQPPAGTVDAVEDGAENAEKVKDIATGLTPELDANKNPNIPGLEGGIAEADANPLFPEIQRGSAPKTNRVTSPTLYQVDHDAAIAGLADDILRYTNLDDDAEAKVKDIVDDGTRTGGVNRVTEEKEWYIKCQKCGWIGTLADVRMPADPRCPKCLSRKFSDFSIDETDGSGGVNRVTEAVDEFTRCPYCDATNSIDDMGGEDEAYCVECGGAVTLKTANDGITRAFISGPGRFSGRMVEGLMEPRVFSQINEMNAPKADFDDDLIAYGSNSTSTQEYLKEQEKTNPTAVKPFKAKVPAAAVADDTPLSEAMDLDDLIADAKPVPDSVMLNRGQK